VIGTLRRVSLAMKIADLIDDGRSVSVGWDASSSFLLCSFNIFLQEQTVEATLQHH
jgi:hypothetical protein